MPLRLPPALTFRPDELYRVPTRDGSAIALGRYFPRGERVPAPPVVLAHSLALNRFNLDFDERYSVARLLARRGLEAWVLELRGHGLAGDAGDATFDTEATYDVEAALTAVRSTGAPTVSWLGHSRGGLLAFAHLARSPSAPIAAVAALGSPLTFRHQPEVARFVASLGPALRLPSVPTALAAVLGPVGLPKTPLSPYLLRAENCERVVLQQALAHAVTNVPGGVARQFARWVLEDAFDGEDGFNYRAALAQVRVPTLAIAGASDRLVPPPSAHLAAQLLGGPVTTVTAGRATGFSTDYGHGDLVLGRRAPEEIASLAADFLVAVRAPAP